MPFHWYIARSSPSWLSAYNGTGSVAETRSSEEYFRYSFSCIARRRHPHCHRIHWSHGTHLETIRARTVTETLLALLELLEETETPRDWGISATARSSSVAYS